MSRVSQSVRRHGRHMRLENARCRDPLAQCGQDAGTHWLGVGSERRLWKSGERLEGNFPFLSFRSCGWFLPWWFRLGCPPARCCFLAGSGAGVGRVARLWCVSAPFCCPLCFHCDVSSESGIHQSETVRGADPPAEVAGTPDGSTSSRWHHSCRWHVIVLLSTKRPLRNQVYLPRRNSSMRKWRITHLWHSVRSSLSPRRLQPIMQVSKMKPFQSGHYRYRVANVCSEFESSRL